MFHFLIIALIHSVFLLFFPGAITVSSILLEFILGTGFGYKILSTILFPMTSPVASVAL